MTHFEGPQNKNILLKLHSHSNEVANYEGGLF